MSGKGNLTKPAGLGVDLNKPTKTFKMVMGLCIVIFVAAVLFFSFIRTRLRQIYAPRLLLIENKIFTMGTFPLSFFSWIAIPFKVTDEDIYAFAGIDALVYLRFMRMVLKFALLTLPYGMIVLLPINITGKNKLVDGLDKLSMSNVATGSSTIWAHWLAVWLYSFVVFYLTYKEWTVYIKYRQRYLAKGTGSQFAVLVKDIPADMTQDGTFKEFVDGIFPNKVSSVHVIHHLKDWDKLIERHDTYVLKWEAAKHHHETKNKRPMLRKHICGEKFDAIIEYEKELELIQEGLLAAKDSTNKPLRCAFVFFKSLKAKTLAIQSVWTSDPMAYDVSTAPDAHEVMWSNLSSPPFIRGSKEILGYVFVFFLVIFWAVPISFISSLTHVESLGKEFSWLKSIENAMPTWLLSFIQGILPVALLSLFFMLLPVILFLVARLQGKVSKSNMALMVFKCLFVFQTFNTFFIYIISGSILQYFSKVIKEPLKIPDLLAQSLPSQAGFFINYLALQSVVGLALEITRVVPLIITTIKLKWIVSTQRETLEAWRPKRAEYEIMYSQAMLFFLIGISYSILAPIIIPFFVLYYAFGYCVWTYQLLHVYIPEYDHGGTFWPAVFLRMMISVIVFQLLMLGVFSLKRVFIAAGLTIPLIIITIGYLSLMSNKFKINSDYLALSEAKDTKYAEKNFIEEARIRYIRNHSLPEVFEVSYDKYNDHDDYNPVSRSINDTDEDVQDTSESAHLLQQRSK